MNFKDRLEHFKNVKEEKDKGIYRYIPFHNDLPKLASYMPGIIPGTNYLFSAATGVGKTKMSRFLTVTIPYNFIKNNPDSKIKFKTVINGLEESVEEMTDAMIVTRLEQKHKLSVTTLQLNGLSPDAIDNFVIEKIEEEMNYFSDLENYVELVNIGNPFGFFKHMREIAYETGKFFDQDGKQIDPKNRDGSWSGYHSYQSNDPFFIPIAVSDHLTLYSKEGKMSKYDTILRFSQQYVRRGMNMQFNMVTVGVQQQNAESTTQQFTNKGQLIVEKLFPTLENLAEVKSTKNDALVVIAAFNPAAYNISEFYGYDVDALGDHFRTWHILKNRKGGGVGRWIPMFMDGKAEIFKEMPSPDNTIELKKVLNRIRRIDRITI